MKFLLDAQLPPSLKQLFIAGGHDCLHTLDLELGNETPERLSPFDRMKKHKIRFLAAGENLALGQTLNICHRGLMNSPGHRANILNPAFGRVGIGILDGGIYGLMITQSFRN